MRSVLEEVAAERARQDAKWGVQNHPDDHDDSWWFGRTDHDAASRRCQEYEIPTDVRAKFLCRSIGTWPAILVEEVAEAVSAIGADAALRAELVQVAAVAVAWVEAIDRRGRAQ